jgi:hypothetical protein
MYFHKQISGKLTSFEKRLRFCFQVFFLIKLVGQSSSSFHLSAAFDIELGFEGFPFLNVKLALEIEGSCVRGSISFYENKTKPCNGR